MLRAKIGGLAFHLASVRVLVLNASYEPIRIVNWQSAMLLWVQDKADVLESHSYQVKSALKSFPLPAVLRLKNYVRPWAKGSARFSRDNVFYRDDYICQYCRKTFPHSQLTLDHVLPYSRGGKKDWTNIVTACRACNHKKANKTPEEARMPLMRKPKILKQHAAKPINKKNKHLVPDIWQPYIFI